LSKKKKLQSRRKSACTSLGWLKPVCGLALAGVQTGFSRFGVFRETWIDRLFAARRLALAGSGFCANSSSLVAEIWNKNPQIWKK
jgi:hypothetical protein